ncbi:hypothetical protein ACQ4M3_40655, partial [Leptolyngbya sp. AN03gr2]|uniref:hypothetical protein n=1 Tax=Leptolyngbya sp. AN03gr2 TaxID=3423364 RepID=UPI003D321BCE
RTSRIVNLNHYSKLKLSDRVKVMALNFETVGIRCEIDECQHGYRVLKQNFHNKFQEKIE